MLSPLETLKIVIMSPAENTFCGNVMFALLVASLIKLPACVAARVRVEALWLVIPSLLSGPIESLITPALLMLASSVIAPSVRVDPPALFKKTSFDSKLLLY